MWDYVRYDYNRNIGSTERYRPRPGIVLDDTLDYTGAQGLPSQRPYVPSRHPSFGDVFDVTVSAIQGPGGSSGNFCLNIKKWEIFLSDWELSLTVIIF